LIWQQQNCISKQSRQSLNFFSCKLLDGIICVPDCTGDTLQRQIKKEFFSEQKFLFSVRNFLWFLQKMGFHFFVKGKKRVRCYQTRKWISLWQKIEIINLSISASQVDIYHSLKVNDSEEMFSNSKSSTTSEE